MSDAARTKLVVIADLPCLRCRYPLRGLATSARCPECGLGIDESIRGAIDLGVTEPEKPGIEPTRRAAWSIPALACAGALGAAAGVILPAAITLVPAGFDPRGLAGSPGQVRAHLDPALEWAGLVTAAAALIALVVTLASRWRRQARRDAIIAVWGGILLLTAAGMALKPGRLGLEAAAEASARGLGNLVRGGKSTPDTAVLVALAFEGVRGLGVAFLVCALGRVLHKFGRRSDTYSRAGQGLQGSGPVVTASIGALAMSGGWFGSIITNGTSLAAALDAVAWPILWLTAACITTLGGAYLATNAIWATAPWRRRYQRLEDLVGSETPAIVPAASMADEDEGERAP
jgi:hypothetical protein